MPVRRGWSDAVRVVDGAEVRMGHLAFIGARRVNGVSALHTELMKRSVFRDLHAMHPDRIVNQTNGGDAPGAGSTPAIVRCATC